MMLSILLTLLAATPVTGTYGRAATYSDLISPNFLSTTPTSGSSKNYTLYKFDMALHPLATCLDGSPGAVYIRPALAPTGAKHYRIFFQGCVTY
jgi:hypothetical protein